MGKRDKDWYVGENAYFINPYNFIPTNFKEKKTESIDEISDRCHTGVLECSLITKSPIAIPDTAHTFVGEDKHREYDFMRDEEGKPMIPASSLRGPIRSMYETLTDSCFSTEKSDTLVTYRTKEAFKAGLLHRTEKGWELYDAKRYIFAVDSSQYKKIDKKLRIHHIKESEMKDFRYGEKVFFKPLKEGEDEKEYRNERNYFVGICIENGQFSKEKFDGCKEGYFCKGEPFPWKKHFESVFKIGKKLKIDSEIDLEKYVENLDKVVKCYNDEVLNRNAKDRKFYEGRVYKNVSVGEYLPIWYSIQEECNLNGENIIKKIHLSVASLGRSIYNRTLGDMLGEKRSCKDKEYLCAACRLFGMIGKDGAVGSRIRITDAVTDKIIKSELDTLKELSSPKPSYLPFYLRNTDGEKWSYDSDHIELRGRKFYWHTTEKKVYSTGEKTERNSSMVLLGKNEEVVFSFKVFYEKLTLDELKQLMWTLTFGENKSEGKQCYKIGHGKSIGLGSVKIVIDRRMERTFSEGSYYNIKEDILEDESVFKNKEILENVKIIADMDACEYPVSYPGMVDRNGEKYNDKKNEHAAHQWFSYNFMIGNNPKRILPEIKEHNLHALQWVTDGGEVGKNFVKGKKSSQREKELIIGKEYEGIVTRYNFQKTKAYIDIPSHGQASVYFKNVFVSGDLVKAGEIDKVLELNTLVQIIYKGKTKGNDGKEYDTWEYKAKDKLK